MRICGSSTVKALFLRCHVTTIASQLYEILDFWFDLYPVRLRVWTR